MIIERSILGLPPFMFVTLYPFRGFKTRGEEVKMEKFQLKIYNNYLLNYQYF
jgi:hypothetical protein